MRATPPTGAPLVGRLVRLDVTQHADAEGLARGAADGVPHRVADGPRADLLLEPDATIASVARQVGYATPFALSAAFKRERGMSPREHRRRGDTAAAVG